MRKTFEDKVEKGRHLRGEYGTAPGDSYGSFLLMGPCATLLQIIATDGDGLLPQWEHVSVSTKHRCPNWIEMCFVKDLFFEDEETVIQFHPPKSQYVNCHPYVLHMWRPVDQPLPLPPKIAV